jgi:hypothetical protein
LSLACGLVLRVLVFHPSRCEVAMVRIDVMVCTKDRNGEDG